MSFDFNLQLKVRIHHTNISYWPIPRCRIDVQDFAYMSNGWNCLMVQHEWMSIRLTLAWYSFHILRIHCCRMWVLHFSIYFQLMPSSDNVDSNESFVWKGILGYANTYPYIPHGKLLLLIVYWWLTLPQGHGLRIHNQPVWGGQTSSLWAIAAVGPCCKSASQMHNAVFLDQLTHRFLVISGSHRQWLPLMLISVFECGEYMKGWCIKPIHKYKWSYLRFRYSGSSRSRYVSLWLQSQEYPSPHDITCRYIWKKQHSEGFL